MRVHLIALMIPTFICSVSVAEDDRFRMMAQLSDGSLLMGEPVGGELRWQTVDGVRGLPVKSSFAAFREEKTWKVENGTPQLRQIEGTLLTPAISMKTLFGEVSLKREHLVKVEVYRVYDQIDLPHPEDLVLYMNFDQNFGKQVRNLASFKHHGQVIGAKWIPNGRRGGAYVFDGQSRIRIPHHDDLCPQAFTLSAWVKPTDPPASWKLIISKTNSSTWYGGYGLYRNYGKDDNLYWYANDYYRTGNVVKDPVRMKEWVHVAGVFDGKNVTMYLNGEPTAPVAPPNGNQQVSHTKTPLMFGAGENGAYPWTGQMDEVMLFKRALTAAEVEKIMVLGLPDEQQ